MITRKKKERHIATLSSPPPFITNSHEIFAFRHLRTHVLRFTVVNGYVELNHRSQGISLRTIRATDHHVNDNQAHTIMIHGDGAEWSLELDKRTTEYEKEHNADIQKFLKSTDLIYIGKLAGRVKHPTDVERINNCCIEKTSI